MEMMLFTEVRRNSLETLTCISFPPHKRNLTLSLVFLAFLAGAREIVLLRTNIPLFFFRSELFINQATVLADNLLTLRIVNNLR